MAARTKTTRAAGTGASVQPKAILGIAIESGSNRVIWEEGDHGWRDDLELCLAEVALNSGTKGVFYAYALLDVGVDSIPEDDQTHLAEAITKTATDLLAGESRWRSIAGCGESYLVTGLVSRHADLPAAVSACRFCWDLSKKRIVCDAEGLRVVYARLLEMRSELPKQVLIEAIGCLENEDIKDAARAVAERARASGLNLEELLPPLGLKEFTSGESVARGTSAECGPDAPESRSVSEVSAKASSAVQELASATLPESKEIVTLEPLLANCIRFSIELATARIGSFDPAPSDAEGALEFIEAIDASVSSRSIVSDAEIASLNACIDMLNQSKVLEGSPERRRLLVTALNAINQLPSVSIVFAEPGKTIPEGAEVSLVYDAPTKPRPDGRFAIWSTRLIDGKRPNLKRSNDLPVRFDAVRSASTEG